MKLNKSETLVKLFSYLRSENSNDMAKVKFIISKIGDDRAKLTLRLTVSSSQKVQTVVPGIMVYRKFWSDAKQTNDLTRKFVKPWEVEEMRQINEQLTNLAAKVTNESATIPTEEITKKWLTEIIDRILHPAKFAPREERPKTLMIAITDLIACAKDGTRTRPKTQAPITAGTIIQYQQTQKTLQRYFDYSNVQDLELQEVNEEFYKSFVRYLYSQGYKMNTVGKHVKNLKAAINALPMAQRAQCEFVEPKKCAKLAEEVDNIYLTEDELNAIATCPITKPYLSRARDQFILLAWTGCRYSDLAKLTKDNIHPLRSGGECFKFEQQKTKTKVIIPILPPARAILEKYDYNLPRTIENQKFNDFIKEVAQLSGLNDEVSITHTKMGNAQPRRRGGDTSRRVERVTERFAKWECVSAHTARRSFATNMYKRNFPTLMIMAITGHKTVKAFLSYIKVTEEENAERMMAQFMAQEYSRTTATLPPAPEA